MPLTQKAELFIHLMFTLIVQTPGTVATKHWESCGTLKNTCWKHSGMTNPDEGDSLHCEIRACVFLGIWPTIHNKCWIFMSAPWDQDRFLLWLVRYTCKTSFKWLLSLTVFSPPAGRMGGMMAFL